MSNMSNKNNFPNNDLGLHTSPNAIQGQVGDASASGQSQEHSGQFQMSPSAQAVTHSLHYEDSSLGIPWNSNDLNQWPLRLFTTAPPTPTGGATLPLASFRLPSGQQELEEEQSVSQLPPAYPDPAPTPECVSQLLDINHIIYKNCKGNKESLWPAIAQEIYNLQLTYGELIILATQPGEEPKYKCGICEHPSTIQQIHTTTKRKWDWSPDILRHGPNKFKPWFCKCGHSFPRDRERRRHAEKCEACKGDQDLLLAIMQGPQASFSHSLSPIPAFPLENTVPQEIVVPRSSITNHNQDAYHGLYLQGPTPPLPLHQPLSSGAHRQPKQANHHQNSRVQRSHPTSERGSRPRGSSAPYPSPYYHHSMHANHGDSSHHIAAPQHLATQMSTLSLQSHDGGSQFMPQQQQPQPQHDGSGPLQYLYHLTHNGGSWKEEKGAKVRSDVPLKDQPSHLEEGLSRHDVVTSAHPFTALAWILLSLAAIFWVVLRLFMLPS